MSTLSTKQNEQPVWEIEAAWPNLTQAARLIGVSKSTLSKQADKGRVAFVSRGLGRGERLIPITEVMRLASVYRKVPMDRFVEALAREAAARSGITESSTLRSLQDLLKAILDEITKPALSYPDTAARVEIPLQNQSTKPVASTVIANRQAAVQETGAMKPATCTSTPRNAGRLRPRVMAESEFPPAALVEAMDSRVPLKHETRIVQKNARVIKLGKLRPGNRGL